jgi:hypothetical protein
MKTFLCSVRRTSLLATLLVSACGVAPPGPTYVPPSGADTAVIRPVWGDANVRVREVNGKGVSMLFPEDVVISPGVTKVGLLAWAGPGPSQVAICLVFRSEPNRKYQVSVASFKRDWAVSLTSDGAAVAPLLVRHREFESSILPCTGS